MAEQTKTRISEWIDPPAPDAQPEPGYDDHVKTAIAEGLADLKAGRVTPADQVWKDLGIE